MASKIRVCSVCGSEIYLNGTLHYIARNNDKSGISAAWSSDEPTLYDAYDCPTCGCQNIIQPRKRIDTSQAQVACKQAIEEIDKMLDEDEDDDEAEGEWLNDTSPDVVAEEESESELEGQMEMSELTDDRPKALDAIDAVRFGVAAYGKPSIKLDDALEKLRLVSEGIVPPTPCVVMSKEELERAINFDLENPQATIYCKGQINPFRSVPADLDSQPGCPNLGNTEEVQYEEDDDDGPGVDLGEICI